MPHPKNQYHHCARSVSSSARSCSNQAPPQLSGRDREEGQRMISSERQYQQPSASSCSSLRGGAMPSKAAGIAAPSGADALLSQGRGSHSQATAAVGSSSSAAQQEATVDLELDHAIGYSPVQGSLHYHPNGTHYIHTIGAVVIINKLTDPHQQSFLRGHDDAITCLANSHSKGKYLASPFLTYLPTNLPTQIGAAIIINSLSDPHQQSFLRGHDDAITCLAISPSSGKYLASGQRGRNADVCLWDFEKQQLLYRLSEHDAGITAIAFSDDERLVATVGYQEDGKLIIWDTSNGYIVTSHLQSPCPTTTLTWAGFVKDIKRRPTSHYFLCSAGDHQIVYWSFDAYTGEMHGEKVSSEGRVNMARHVTCVAFTEDREMMFAGTTSGDFVVALTKERKIRRTITACQGPILSLIILPGHPQTATIAARALGGVLVGGGDGTLSYFDSDFIKQAHVNLKGGVLGLALGRDLIDLMAGTDLGYVYRVRLHLNNNHISNSARGTTGAAGLLEAQPNGPNSGRRRRGPSSSGREPDPPFAAAAAAAAGAPSLSYLSKPLLLCENHSAAVKSVQYAKEASDRFATISSDCTIRVWDASDYSVITSIHARDAGSPQALVYSADLLISGWQDGQIRTYDSDSGSALWCIPNAHKGGVTSLCLSHNHRFLLSGGAEGDVRLWELRSRGLVSHLKGHHLPVTSIAIYQDDLHAISVSLDRSIICWDLRTEKRVSTHVQRMGGINKVELSPNETTVITTGQEKRLTYWDLREHEPIGYRNLSPKSSDESKGIALSPDGRYVATAGTAHLLKLWEIEQVKMMTVGVGHSATVNDVKFSPDGKQVVTVGDDGAVLMWNVYYD